MFTEFESSVLKYHLIINTNKTGLSFAEGFTTLKALPRALSRGFENSPWELCRDLIYDSQKKSSFINLWSQFIF